MVVIKTRIVEFGPRKRLSNTRKKNAGDQHFRAAQQQLRCLILLLQEKMLMYSNSDSR